MTNTPWLHIRNRRVHLFSYTDKLILGTSLCDVIRP